MIERFKAYLRKHFPFVAFLEVEPKPLPERRKLGKSEGVSLVMRIVIGGLQVLPWVCGAMFIMGFFPYFSTPYTWTPRLLGWELSLDFTNIIRTIAVSGLIGFGTNFLAIRMLFRPIEKRPIWGQGLIPAQRDRIIYKLAEGMHTHILSQELIRKRVEETGLVKKVNDLVMDGTIGLLKDEELRQELKYAFTDAIHQYASRNDIRQEIRGIIDLRLEDRLDKGLKKFVFQTYKRYNKEEYDQAIDQVVAEIPKVAREVMDRTEAQLDRLAAYLRKERAPMRERIMEIFIKILNSIDITDLLAKQMAYLDERRLEKMVWEATNEQLLYIQYLGTLLGMLGGLLIWEPILTTVTFLLTFLLLFGFDMLLFTLRKR